MVSVGFPMISQLHGRIHMVEGSGREIVFATWCPGHREKGGAENVNTPFQAMPLGDCS